MNLEPAVAAVRGRRRVRRDAGRRPGRTLASGVNDRELEELLERIEVSVPMNERVLRANAERRNQAVDRFANSVAVAAKRPIVVSSLVPNALEHLAEDEISEAETLSVQRRVHPLGLGIRDAAQV